MADIVKKAREFSKRAHKGQKQATGKPYFKHPERVVELLKKWKQDEEVISAGYLHDVVEDSNVSLKQISKKFGKRVAYLVDGMSWIRDKRNMKKNWPKSYKKFSKIAKKDPHLVIIKIADMISNIPNVHAKSHRRWIVERSYPRNMRFFVPFIKESGFPKQAARIVKAFHKYTKKRIKSVLHDYISKKDLRLIKKKLKHNKLS